ncbi:Translation Initiation factor eIF- 4e [Trinorchestia longiramus]|nr:Translation Initiation factor eIF- 4e [Trinorchestia longiramus]
MSQSNSFSEYWRQNWFQSMESTGKSWFLAIHTESPATPVRRECPYRWVDCAISRLCLSHVGVAAHLHRFQLLESPLWQCGQVETVEHFLLKCDYYSAQRHPLKRLLQCLGLQFNLKNVLGVAGGPSVTTLARSLLGAFFGGLQFYQPTSWRTVKYKVVFLQRRPCIKISRLKMEEEEDEKMMPLRLDLQGPLFKIVPVYFSTPWLISIAKKETFLPTSESLGLEGNVNGGRWKLWVRKGVIDRCWENLLLAVVGEQFEVGDEICGIVMCIRNQEDTLAIWNKTASDQRIVESIRKKLVEVLQLPSNTFLEYKSHTQAMKETFSGHKTFPQKHL